MFESLKNAINGPNACSESREQLKEKKQPVSKSPALTGNRVTEKRKRKKRKKKQQQAQESEKRSVPEPRPLSPGETLSVHGRKEKSGNESKPIVRGIFQIGKKSHDVVLTSTRVTWTRIQPESPAGEASQKKPVEDFVELKDVFAVKVKRRRSAGQQSGGTLLGITLFFCKRKGAKLKDDTIHLDNLSVDHCEIWFKHLKEILNGFKHRPKSLKVFVNPISYKKDAYQIYKDRVAPLLKLADIQTDVTVTERKGHALSILKECSLDQYDGVVCVGGDGSVAEVVQGLLLRAQMDAERDRQSAFMPIPASLPLGVIPAGSANVVACSVNGVKHPVTAALHIILGHRQPVDMCSLSSMGVLLQFGFCVMVGFGGQALTVAERLNWIPPTQRHELALVTALAQLRPEDCELSFIPSSSGESDHTQSELEEDLSDVVEDADWQVRRGLYLSLTITSIPCLCSVAPKGLAPFTRLNNNSMALTAVANTSRSEFIKHLKRYSSSNNPFSFSFVEVQRVRAVKLGPCSRHDDEQRESKHTAIIPSEGTLTWNIDGELMEVQGEVLIRVHPKLLELFGTDVEEAEEPPVNCSCI
ncbi:ceramide kinase-like protein isoform X3 [Tachysurus fulvidraco]|uniref:ceramide kinase-like protein isoform X3 n=1 Tax=Tachysurus fulvidraco TaxID=1234273 RepID=UPI001FEE39A6|nr:ceramide kinase-like protein isoform X3 [Tachysurus fulvidraco]